METNSIISIGGLNLRDLEKSIYTKLDSLCDSVLGKKIENLTDSQVVDLINLDINTHVKSLTIYAQSTRQVVQFEPNSYSATQVIDLENASLYIKSVVMAEATPQAKIQRYAELRAMLYKLMYFKYNTAEDFLRELLRASEVKDGAPGRGRFS